MTQITKDAFDALPESVQSLFELSGDEYVTIDSLKLSKLKGNLDNVYAERDTLRNQMSEAEKAKADEIANAREEAYQDAIANNDFAKQARLLEEKRQDADNRANATKEELTSLRQSLAQDKHNVLIAELSSLATEQSKGVLEVVLRSRTQIDPTTQEEIYLNADGSASSLDKKGFIDSLSSDPMFKPHLKATLPTNGGGKANGSLAGSATGGLNRSKMSADQKAQYISEYGQQAFLQLNK